MSLPEKLAAALITTVILLAVVWGMAAVFSPDFRKDGASIVLAISGMLGTFATAVLTGSYLTRNIREDVQRERLSAEKEIARTPVAEDGGES